MKGDNNPLFGKKNKWGKLTEKVKQELSKVNSGENHPMFGKHRSKETRQKISNSLKGRYCRKDNPNWKNGISGEVYCPVFKDKEWREYIYERDKDRFCWNLFCEGEGTIECLHHINYDKKDCCYSNIIKVCNSCNSKANFNREWWKAFYIEIMRRRELL